MRTCVLSMPRAATRCWWKSCRSDRNGLRSTTAFSALRRGLDRHQRLDGADDDAIAAAFLGADAPRSCHARMKRENFRQNRGLDVRCVRVILLWIRLQRVLRPEHAGRRGGTRTFPRLRMVLVVSVRGGGSFWRIVLADQQRQVRRPGI